MTPSATKPMLVVKVVGQMLFFFGFLAWLDGVVVQFTHPEWLPMRVSHLLNVRTDNFTIAMFFVCALGFLMWRITAEFLKNQEKTRVA